MYTFALLLTSFLSVTTTYSSSFQYNATIFAGPCTDITSTILSAQDEGQIVGRATCFNHTSGSAMSLFRRELYITERYRVRRINLVTNTIQTVLGSIPPTNKTKYTNATTLFEFSKLKSPIAIALRRDETKGYISDTGVFIIYEASWVDVSMSPFLGQFNKPLRDATQAGNLPRTITRLQYVRSIVVFDGVLYVGDGGTSNILRYRLYPVESAVVVIVGNVNHCTGIAGYRGRLYVGRQMTLQVAVISLWTFYTFLGVDNEPGWYSGNLVNTRFQLIISITVDPARKQMYLSDFGSNQVKRFSFGTYLVDVALGSSKLTGIEYPRSYWVSRTKYDIDGPWGVSVDQSRAYVNEYGRGAITTLNLPPTALPSDLRRDSLSKTESSTREKSYYFTTSPIDSKALTAVETRSHGASEENTPTSVTPTFTHSNQETTLPTTIPQTPSLKYKTSDKTRQVTVSKSLSRSGSSDVTKATLTADDTAEQRLPTSSPTHVVSTEIVEPTVSAELTETTQKATYGNEGDETTSVPLRFYEVGTLRWLTRPIPHVASGLPLSVQPSVQLFHSNNEPWIRHPRGVVCFLEVEGNQASILSAAVAMVDSVCSWSEAAIIGLEALHPGTLITLNVFVNTTKLFHPSLRRYPANSTQLRISDCKTSTSRIHWFYPTTLQLGEKSNILLKGFYFPWSLRRRTQCVILNENMTKTTSSIRSTWFEWIDLCTARCGFTQTELGDTPLRGILAVEELSSARVQKGTCEGNPMTTTTTSCEGSMMFGCVVRVVGPPTEATINPSPPNNSLTIPADPTIIIPQLTFDFCDSARNPVPVVVAKFSVKSSTDVSVLQKTIQVNPGSNNTLQLLFGSITVPRVKAQSTPLLFLYDTIIPITYGFYLSTGRPVQLKIMNADEIIGATDTASTLPIAPIITAFDVLQNPVQLNASRHTLIASVLFKTYQVLDTFPLNEFCGVEVVHSTIRVTQPGTGYLLMFTLVEDRINVTSVMWNQTVTSSFCQASTEFHVINVTYYHRDGIGRDAAPVGPAGDDFSVDVVGWKYSHHYLTNLWCLYDVTGSGTSGAAKVSQATWVSPCLIRCRITNVQFPIKPNQTSTRGKLMVRFGDAKKGVWSNGVDFGIVGPAVKMDAKWNSDASSLRRGEKTPLPGLSVFTLDETGQQLLNYDVPRNVVVWAEQNTIQKINKTAVYLVQRIDNGTGVFSNYNLIQPDIGDYPIYVQSPQLQTKTMYLTVLSNTTASRVIRFLTRPSEKSLYVSMINDGILPSQPSLGVFLNNDTYPDQEIINMFIYAKVEPVNREYPVKEGPTDNDCYGMKYGSCASVSAGTANFTSLRFEGFKNQEYVITFNISSDKVSVEPLRMRVRVADCPAIARSGEDQDYVLASVTPSNASTLTPTAVTVKGWMFDYQQANNYVCRFNGSFFPALFKDSCTVICFTTDDFISPTRLPPEVPLCEQSPLTTCCWNGISVACSAPVFGRIEIWNSTHNVSSTVKYGPALNFAFIGDPRGIKMLVPEFSESYVNDSFPIAYDPFIDHQIIRSAEVTVLAPITLSFVDVEQTPLGDLCLPENCPGDVFSLIDIQFVPQGGIISGLFNNQTSKWNRDANSTCYPRGQDNNTLVRNTKPSYNGTLDCYLSENVSTCTFDQIVMHRPLTGRYDLTFQSHRNHTFTTKVIVHILPGIPVRLCLETNWDNVETDNKNTLSPNPTLMGLDASGNVYKPFIPWMTADSILLRNYSATLRYYDITNGTYIPYESINDTMAFHEEETEGWYFVLPSSWFITFYHIRFIGFNSRTYALGFESASMQAIHTPPIAVRRCYSTNEFAVINKSRCDLCPQGREYCLSTTKTICFNCNGTTVMLMNGSFWRAGPELLYAHECANGACISGTETGTCVEGYVDHSPLCAVCQPGYSHNSDGTCSSCPNRVISIVVVVTVVVFVVIFFILFVIVTFKSTTDENEDSLILSIKILLNYVQINSLLSDFKINLPQALQDLLGVQRQASGSVALGIASPLECLYPEKDVLDKFLPLALYPLGGLGATGLILYVLYIIQQRNLAKKAAPKLDSTMDRTTRGLLTDMLKREGSLDQSNVVTEVVAEDGSAEDEDEEEEDPDAPLDLKRVFETTVMIVLFVLYQTLAKQCANILDCVPIRTRNEPTNPSDETTAYDYYLLADMSVECKGERYELFYSRALVFLMLYGLGIPGVGMVAFLLRAKNVGWEVVFKQYSFFIEGYQTKYWYFELLVMLRKMTLILIIALEENGESQALMAIWILHMAVSIHLVCQPYVKAIHNRVEALSQLSVCVSLNVALFASKLKNSGLSLVAVLLIIVNVIALAYFAWSILLEAKHRFLEIFGKTDRDGVMKKFSRKHFVNVVRSKMGFQKRLRMKDNLSKPECEMDTSMEEPFLSDDDVELGTMTEHNESSKDKSTGSGVFSSIMSSLRLSPRNIKQSFTL
eukprot:PhF_6_TR44191/c0_g1_i1/m.67770